MSGSAPAMKRRCSPRAIQSIRGRYSRGLQDVFGVAPCVRLRSERIEPEKETPGVHEKPGRSPTELRKESCSSGCRKRRRSSADRRGRATRQWKAQPRPAIEVASVKAVDPNKTFFDHEINH